jgi:CHAT domain-containing protein/tetratricopeptide (TPR) repeat protein
MNSFVRSILLLIFLATFMHAKTQSFNAEMKLARDFYNSGNYQDAAVVYEKWIHDCKRFYGADDTVVFTKVMTWAATSFTYAGSFEKAEYLYTEVLQIDQAISGEHHLSVARDLYNLGWLYRKMGRYEKAEPLLVESMKIFKNKLGDKNPEYATRLNNVALLYKLMGRYDQAELLYKEAIRIDKEKLGPEHPSYTRDLINLAGIYRDLSHYDKAEDLIKESMLIDEKKLGKDHPSYARDLNILALVYQKTGRLAEAELLLKEALEIYKMKLDKYPIANANVLNNLAQIYETRCQYELAEPLFKESLEIIRRKLGERHPDFKSPLTNLAQLYKVMDRFDLAEPLMKEGFAIVKQQLKNNTGVLSEYEIEKFQFRLLRYLEGYQSFNISLAMKDSTSDAGAFAFSIELNRKGSLMQANQKIRNQITESGDTLLINTFNSLLSKRRQLEKLYSLEPENQVRDSLNLEQEAGELEKKLALLSPEYHESIDKSEITWKDIQKQLGKDEAVVEFLNFRYYGKSWTDSIFYCALVLRPGFEYPKMIFLFEEKVIRDILDMASHWNPQTNVGRLYNLNRGTELVNNEGDSIYRTNALYKFVWQPLDPFLKGVKTVWYTPSGLLQRISFPSIGIKRNEKLCDRFQMNCLSSSREFINQSERKDLMASLNLVALFGGIRYESTNNLVQWGLESSGRQQVAMRSTWLPGDSSRKANFSFLPGTLSEVNSIDQICRNHHVSVSLYTEGQATEEGFKSLSGKDSPGIIHLATHGFFFNDPRKDFSSRKLAETESDIYNYAEDPLLRSGLILAGANRAWIGDTIPEGVENGILQAKEVSNLDFRNTKLVVLSACETGLGNVRGSEGVFGLQRSFKMAGVDYLLMSLWQVPDEATRKLMTMFYENLFDGQQIREAFTSAQKKLRRMNKDYEDPYYWGAWVLTE